MWVRASRNHVVVELEGTTTNESPTWKVDSKAADGIEAIDVPCAALGSKCL
jgi:hypothetical protein